MDPDCPARPASTDGGVAREALGGGQEFLETQRSAMGFSGYTG